MKRNIAIALLFTILISMFSFDKVYAYNDYHDKRVLFISSYSYAWDTVQIQIEGIKQGLGEGITIDYEFMDTKRFPNEKDIEKFYHDLRYRLSKLDPYDVVILGDDAALNFAIKYRDDLFKDIPLIFEGINDEAFALEVAKDSEITGVLEKLSFDENINFALTLFPDATKVVGILDNSVTGQAERKSFYKHAEEFPELEFSEINTSELTSEELKQSIASISEDTILIYVVMTEDASGKKYTNSQSVKLIAENSSVPAFRMVSGGIGEGLLGGNIVSMELSGEIAARMATEIVNGRAPITYDSVVESPNVYCIDESVMRKFNLDLSLIPEGAIIINHEPSFWERNKEMIIPTIIIVILLIAVIVTMFRKMAKQHLLTDFLQKETEKLEYSSTYDLLTEIANRSKLYKDLDDLIKRNSTCSVFIFDVDGFKGINDTYGHACGDEVLKEIGTRLTSISSKNFIPYRLAGDEFICILKSNLEKDIEAHIHKCINAFKDEFVLSTITLPIRISLGVSSFPDDSREMTTLIECADQAMYIVKKNGKNSYMRYKNIPK